MVTVNIVVIGIGGQGILRATDLIATAVLLSGYDVKKTEVHGMSQRGGTVVSDVRFGTKVLSPTIPYGEADFLIALDPAQKDANLFRLKNNGVVLSSEVIEVASLPSPKTLNTAMVGLLSKQLPIPESNWLRSIELTFPPKFWEINKIAFKIGKRLN